MFKHLIAFNQMAGPLFFEKVGFIAEAINVKSIIVTGHPDTINKKLVISKSFLPPHITGKGILTDYCHGYIIPFFVFLTF